MYAVDFPLEAPKGAITGYTYQATYWKDVHPMLF